MTEKKDVKNVKAATPEVKEAVKPVAAPVKAVAPANVAAPAKVAEEKVAEKKTTEKKVEEVAKTPAKRGPKKGSTKKASKKTESVTRIVVEYQNNNTEITSVEEKVKAQFVAEGHRAGAIKKLDIYVKPEDYKAYYVINDKFSGCVNLF